MSAPDAIPVIEAAFVWPAPTVTNIPRALDDTSCSVERLTALFKSNTSDFQELIEAGHLKEGWPSDRAYAIWMIYVLAGEKLAEIDAMISALTGAAHAQPATAIGKHVEIRRRALFVERLEAFRAADAVKVPDGADDETFNSIAIPASEALMAFINTRSPDLRALHEKFVVIHEQGVLSNTGVSEALFLDIEHLARRFEIGRDDAAEAEA